MYRCTRKYRVGDELYRPGAEITNKKHAKAGMAEGAVIEADAPEPAKGPADPDTATIMMESGESAAAPKKAAPVLDPPGPDDKSAAGGQGKPESSLPADPA